MPIQVPVTSDSDSKSSSLVPPVLPIADRARWAKLLIGIVLVATLGSLWADLDLVDLLNSVISGERVTELELQNSDDRTGMMATINVIALVLSAITFLLWYSRAYNNVAGLGVRNPRWKRRDAVLCWFVPILNLFRPKEVVNDIWRGSDPDLPQPAANWQSRPVAAVIHLWWAAWLVSGFIGNRVVSAAWDTDASTVTPQEVRDQAMGFVVVDVLDIVAAILAIIVITRVTRRQEERIARYEAGTLTVAPTVAVPAPEVV